MMGSLLRRQKDGFDGCLLTELSPVYNVIRAEIAGVSWSVFKR